MIHIKVIVKKPESTKYYQTNRVILEVKNNGFKPGDIIKIEHIEKRTGAIIEEIHRGNDNIIMEHELIKNLDVEEGDSVIIEKIHPPYAETIKIEIPPELTYMIHTILEEIKRNLKDRPTEKDNCISLYIGKKEFFLRVTSTTPAGIVMVTDTTSIEKDVPSKVTVEKPLITAFSLKTSIDPSLSYIKFEKPTITFNDLGGLEVVKKKLRPYIELIRHPEMPSRFNIKIQNILLYGPPGTGKTVLAKAFAAECGTNFISLTPADILSKYVGEGVKIVKSIFSLALQNAPCIIFIDEFESIAHKRYEMDHTNDIVNQLLIELTNIKDVNKILVIAATNQRDLIDEAFYRRFPLTFVIPLPDEKTRENIFSIYLRDIPIEENILGHLASLTTDFSGGDIESLCNDAAVLAQQEKSDKIYLRHFEASINDYKKHKKKQSSDEGMYH